MTRRASALAGAAALLLALGAAFARRSMDPVRATIVVGVAVAFVSVFVRRGLAESTRGQALLVAFVGGLAGTGVALWIHQDLRGERPDPGPEPVRHARREVERAPARTDPGGPLMLVVWSDSRNSTMVQERLVNEIRLRDPDATVGLGDLVGMARTYQFEMLRDRFARGGAPLLLVPGNHDRDPFGTLKPYARVFGAPTWAARMKGVLLLGIDSSLGHVDPGDVAWLEEQAAPWTGPVLLFSHYPLFAPKDHPKKGLARDEAGERLVALAERLGATVLSGNFHGWSDEEHGRVRQVVTGGAGSRLESATPYHCALVTVGDVVNVEQIVLAQKDDVNELTEQLRVLRDEGAYAGGEFPVRMTLVVAGAAVLLGGVWAALRGRRSSHSSSASSV